MLYLAFYNAGLSQCQFTIVATPVCSAVGNTFDIEYTISGTATGPFTISESRTNSSVTGQSNTGTIASLPYASTSQNNKVTLTIIDEATGCSINYEVLQLLCRESLSCDCSSHQTSIIAQASANGQTHSMVYVLTDPSGNILDVDTEGTFPNVLGNDPLTVYAFNIEDDDFNSFFTNIFFNTNISVATTSIISPFDSYCYTFNSAEFDCACPTCADIIVDATTECAADGSENYTIVINDISGGDALNGNYFVFIDGSQYTYPTDFPLQNQQYTPGDQSVITLTVTDANNNSCTTTYNVFELNCVPQESCNCSLDPNSYTINAQASGNANGHSMLYILVDPAGNYIDSNASGNFSGLLGDGTSYTVYAVNYDNTDIGILSDVTSGFNISELTTPTGNFIDYCYSYLQESFSESCDCGACSISPETATNIICDDSGTPEDDSDDTFTFSILVNGSNTMTGSSSTFNDDQGNLGQGYGSTVNYGPYLISGGNIIVTFTDVDDGTCTNSVTVAAPASCSFICLIDPVILMTECDDNGSQADPSDDTYTFTIMVDGMNSDPAAAGDVTDSEGNTISYGTSQSYGPYPISGGNTTINFTDVDDPLCMASLEVMAPASCSNPVCTEIIISATTECASDGTYTIVINSITGGDGVAGTYTVTIGGNNYIYPTEFPLGNQMYSGNNQTGILLEVVDNDNSTCTGTSAVFELNCLDQEVCDCDIDPVNSLTINAQATGNALGHSMFYVLVDANGIVIATNATGTFAGLLGNGSNYTVYAVNYNDNDLGILTDIPDLVGDPVAPLLTSSDPFDAYCYTTMAALFSEDCACTLPVCDINPQTPINIICSDNNTPEDPDDDTFTFQIVVNGMNTNAGASNTAFDNQGNTGIVYGATISYGPFSISGGPVTVNYTDTDDALCMANVTAQAPETCSFSCSIEVVDGVGECNDNGTPEDPTDDFFTFDVNVGGMNTNPGASNMVTDDQGNTIAYGQDQMYGPFPVSGGDIMITYTDIDNPDCTASVLITAPATCSISCNLMGSDALDILCDDNGTPNDPSDDTYTFSITINGANTDPNATNTFSDDQGNNGIAYGSNIDYGPFPISGGDITVIFTDSDDATCTDMVIAAAPDACSMAGCSDIVLSASSVCDPGGGETFAIDIQSITGGDGNGTDYNVTIAGTTYSYPADFPLTGLTYSGTGGVQQKIEMFIEDADDPTCTISYEVFELNCVPQETCDCDDSPFSYRIQVQASADANGYDLVYILADGTNATVSLDGNFPALLGTNVPYTVYAVHVESSDLLTILSVNSLSLLDELLARTGSFATACYTVSEQEFIGDCACSTECSINNLTVSTTCDGSVEGTYDIEVCFTVNNPVFSEFTISIDGQDVGPFAYSALDANGCIILTSADIVLVGDGDTNVPISIFDGYVGNAIDPFISEFHYDDDSIDDNEGVEISGADGFDLTGYQLIAYNGNGGADYRTVNLSGIISGSPCGSLFFEISGLQNGPDGFALVDPQGIVLEFLSYEGVFVASSGPATGISSVDVGVSESSGLDTESLQLTDAGWIGPVPFSPGVINENLTCGNETSSCLAETVFDEMPCFDPCGSEVVVPILPDITESCTIEDLFVSIAPGEVLEPVPASNLFFSEYIEGSSNNKCFEIFNGTGVPVDLTGWSVSVYVNGSPTPTNSTLPNGVVIADGDVFVVCNTNADPAALAVTDANIGGVTGFNGNDDLALVDPNGVIVDFIGTVSILLNYGTDMTFVRDCSIVEGRTDSTSLFIPTDEWTALPTDDFSNLGTHDYCGLGFVPVDCTFNVYLADPATGALPILDGVEEGFDIDDLPVDITNSQVFFISCVNEFGCESAVSTTQIFIQDLGTIACEDLVQVSLGSPCEYEVPGSLLFSDGRKISFYDLTLLEADGDTVPDAIVTRNEAGQTLDYKLIDLCSGVSCWGQIKVELKRKPFVVSPCSFIPGSEQVLSGSFSDDGEDEYSFEVIDECQTVNINISASSQYACGTQQNPDWCNGTYTVTVQFHNIIVHEQSGLPGDSDIELDGLQTGDYTVLIEPDQVNAQGNYSMVITVSNCDPPIDCVLICAVNDPIDSLFFGSLVKPSNGFKTLLEVRFELNQSCYQEVLELRETISESGDLCSGGIRREVTYTGLVEGPHGEKDRVDIIKQVYTEVQTPFDAFQVPYDIVLPCETPNHPDSIFNRFFIENNSIADSIAISSAYPYVYLKGMSGGQIIRRVTVQDSVIDHYLFNLDTVKVERLINDEWLLVELINKELRDSIRYVSVMKYAYVLIPFRPDNAKCNYDLTFDDFIVPKCGNEVLTLRTWTFIDWCTQEIQSLPTQRIQNIDSGPVIQDTLLDQTISIDPFVCTASFQLPNITAIDACGNGEDLTVEWKSDEGRITDGYVLDLWEDNSPVTLIATVSDACGNSDKDTMLLTINDFVPPTAICYSELEVSITDGGLVLLDAVDFDNGSHDFGCGDVWVKAIRVENLRGYNNGYWNRRGPDRQADYSQTPDPSFTFRYTCGNEDADDFRPLYLDEETESRILGVDIGKQVFYDDQIGICCVDVESDDVYVMVRIFDVDPGEGPVDPRRMEVLPTGPIFLRDRLEKNRLIATNNSLPNDLFGHFSDCLVKVNFSNKLVPKLTCQNYQIDCLTDLSTIPPAVPRGGVCVSTRVELASESEIGNSCGNGEIIQEWYIDTDDVAGFSDADESCIQIISVNEGPGQFDPYTIKWPKHMDGSTLAGMNIECMEDSIYNENIEVQMGEAMNCIPSFDTESSKALWCAPSCALVGYSIDIDTIEASEACLKILRHHTIIDWCLWEPNSSNPEVDSDGFIAVEDWAQGDCLQCENGETPIAGGIDQIYLKYTSVDPDGFYNFSQVLKVLDTTQPDVLVQDTFYVDIMGQGDKSGTQIDCQASGVISALAEDFCGLEATTQVLLAWDVTVYDTDETILFSEYQLTDTFSFDSPLGMDDDVYRVVWEVRDGCGNSSTAESFIVYNDVAAPVPLCVQGTTTAFLQPENEVTIWAKDFDLGSYDACSDISFSIVGRGAEPLRPGELAFEDQQSITLECQVFVDVAQLDVWVWDTSGNGRRCPVNVVINEVCDDDVVIPEGSALITGFIQTETGVGVEAAEVGIHTTAPEYPITTTSSSAGAYSFINNPFGLDYDLDVYKTGDYLNGVSTFDLLAIQRHILGQATLDSPYKLIAADVNDDQRISSLDIVSLRNVILGLSRRFANNLSWRFIDAGFEFEDPQNPWPFTEKIFIDQLREAMLNQNFIGVKIGDVNGDVQANNAMQAQSRQLATVEFTTNDQDLLHSDMIRVPVFSHQQNVEGFQFTLEHPKLILLDIEKGAINMSEANIGKHSDLTTFSYYGGIEESDEEPLFTLVFTSKQDIVLSDVLKISSAITRAEAYENQSTEIKGLSLHVIKSPESAVELFQNSPNPFSLSTSIEFFLPSDMAAQLLIHNVQGQQIFKLESSFKQGLNRIDLNQEVFQHTGIYYYELMTANAKLFKKMLFVE